MNRLGRRSAPKIERERQKLEHRVKIKNAIEFSARMSEKAFRSRIGKWREARAAQI